ncbi:hypothetical protein HAX54_014605, partial [Datura stramonium]|nr:hypothetical protein [Datura stramonium]
MVEEGQGKEIQEGTNIEAEAITIREVLAHCVAEGIELLVLETYSLLLYKVLTKVWKIPWNIAEIVEDLRSIAQMGK